MSPTLAPHLCLQAPSLAFFQVNRVPALRPARPPPMLRLHCLLALPLWERVGRLDACVCGSAAATPLRTLPPRTQRSRAAPQRRTTHPCGAARPRVLGSRPGGV